MAILNFCNLKNTIEKNIEMNADKSTDEDCFHLLANKDLLEQINNNKNEVIFGIRGTGKTTLLKAFNYYINNLKGRDENTACYFNELVSKVPNDIELKNLNNNEASIKVIKYYLYELFQFIFNDYCLLDNKEYSKITFFKSSYTKKELDQLLKLLIEFESLITKGSPFIKCVDEKFQEYRTETQQKGIELSLGTEQNYNLKNLIPKVKLSLGRRIKGLTNSNYAEQLVYNFDIYEIRKKLIEIFKYSGLKKIFICIDEFYLIDKDMNNTIQPEVSQLIKELFFKDNIYCVKISSVYSESKMQMRQNNQRKGLEINNDIFAGPNLDAMHKDDNEAKIFFKRLLGNMVLLYNPQLKINNYEGEVLFSEEVVKKLFQNEFVFERLVCGSQGVPRKFLILLDNCLKATLEKHITINTVINEILKDYNVDLAMTVDYSRTLIKKINSFIEKNKCRFFFINKMDYRNHFFAIKELIEKEIIQMYVGMQLPREISNSYKLFTTHYGNYLGALGSDALTKFANAPTSKEVLFPKIPEDIDKTIEEYTLEIPDIVEKEYYCCNCRKVVLVSDIKNRICPICECKIEVFK